MHFFEEQSFLKKAIILQAIARKVTLVLFEKVIFFLFSTSVVDFFTGKSIYFLYETVGSATLSFVT